MILFSTVKVNSGAQPLDIHGKPNPHCGTRGRRWIKFKNSGSHVT